MPRILQYNGISALSRTIRFMTWADNAGPRKESGTSHTAWEMDDGRVIEAWHRPNGVRVIDGFAAGHTPGTEVRAYRLPHVSHFNLDLAERYLLDQVGKPYDVRGVLRFITRNDPQPYYPDTFKVGLYNPDKWFCSCLVFAALLHGGCKLLERVPPWRVSPNLINLSPLLQLDDIMVVPDAASEEVGRGVATSPHRHRSGSPSHRTFRMSGPINHKPSIVN